jgi:hypothetical protein
MYPMTLATSMIFTLGDPKINLYSHIETVFLFINIDTQIFNVWILRQSRRPIVHDPGECLVYQEMVHAMPVYQLV